jgi:RimJ/RimL family protein N-acetyltransferase
MGVRRSGAGLPTLPHAVSTPYHQGVPTPLPLFADIHTARLVVRAVAESDLADLLEVNGDDEVTRYLPYATWRNHDDALAWLGRTHWRLLSLGFIHEGRLRQRWVSKGESYDTNVYGLLVDDWRKRNAEEVT